MLVLHCAPRLSKATARRGKKMKRLPRQLILCQYQTFQQNRSHCRAIHETVALSSQHNGPRSGSNADSQYPHIWHHHLVCCRPSTSSLYEEIICFALVSCSRTSKSYFATYLPKRKTCKGLQPSNVPLGLMLLQVLSLAQDAFNAACELHFLCNVSVPKDQC